MTQVQWDQVGERRFETGVDHGVLYIPNSSGEYEEGFAWNGLTPSPSRLLVRSRSRNTRTTSSTSC
jgi:hypothetical protein